MTLRERLDTCDVAVRSHLDDRERVLAIGRCEDMTERGNVDRGGAAWTYVMVTDRRVRWVPRADLRFEASLDLAAVTAVSEKIRGHRFAVSLEHAPLTRLHAVPAHRFLHFEWGNAVATAAFTRTELAFSRHNTQAAVALREQVSRHIQL